jgi:hypothetical protein
MAKSGINIEVQGMNKLFKRLNKLADKELQQEVELWLEGSGMQFLEEVQLMIKSMQVVDTRRLLNSFNKGAQGGVWTKSVGGLRLTVGTNVDYARYVNDGHWTDSKSAGRPYRFVPGTWSGGKFTYIPGHSEGMILALQYIDGKPYFDNAVTAFRKIFAASFETRVRDWTKRVGKG